MQRAAFTGGLPLQGIGSMSLSQHSVQILHNAHQSIKNSQQFSSLLPETVMSPCWFLCTKRH